MRKHKSKAIVCDDCGNKRERCKLAVMGTDRQVKLVCPQCWKSLDYDRYITEGK